MLREDCTSDVRRLKEWMLDDEKYIVNKRIDNVIGVALFAGCMFGMMVMAGVMS